MNKERAIQLMHLLAASVGGTVSDIKLMALLYFVDRKTFEKHASFITFDDYFSGDNGPVLEGASAIMARYEDVRFTTVFNPPACAVSPMGISMQVFSLKEPVEDLTTENEAFDSLSEADHKIVKAVLANLGALSDDEIVGYATEPQHCPEWVKPEISGTMAPIEPETLMKHLSFSESEIAFYAQEIQYWKFINRHSLFASD